MKKIFIILIVLTMMLLCSCNENNSNTGTALPDKAMESGENSNKGVKGSEEQNNANDGQNSENKNSENKSQSAEKKSTPAENKSAAENDSTAKNSEEPKQTTLPEDEINKLNNDNFGWGFRKLQGTRPEFTEGQKSVMSKYGCIYIGNENDKKIYLTFDEGYENGYTASILDTLKEKGVKATFFITGPYLDKNTDLVKRMLDEGHIVGNHTVHHPNMPSLVTAQKMEEEITSLDRNFNEIFGKHMKYFRPPEGAYSERSLAASNAAGYTTVLWSFAYRDWETGNQKGSEYAFKSVTGYLHNGCVMLLHAVSSDNASALGNIIDEVRAQGYTFESLDDFAY
ncbi:MAG: delta-lactam-biosynthetic de-N-acetylase [Bacillota bacterium]|nr:delta-lactam-biosynthetic de-N-acetylase [Bacillota bacterium]